MYYTFSAKTDQGLIRRNNEDAVLVDEICGVAVLADGMGGYNAGEVASGMATTLIAAELSRRLTGSAPLSHPNDICHALATSVGSANQAILQVATNRSDCAGMGTTLVAGIFQADHLYLTHLGDSRCYLLRDEALTQITKDHSIRQELPDAGQITRAEGARAQGRNLLTHALGVEAEVPVEICTFQVVPGDLYLMCSDGLTDMVDDACMTGLMVQEKNMVKLASSLINMANAKGGRDNIGVILIHAKDAPDKAGKLSRLLVG